jgi:hypothetical protein
METIFETQRNEQDQPIQVAVMQRIQVNLTYAVHPGALTEALKAALPGKIIGVSTGGANRPVEVYLTLAATVDDEPTVTTTVMAHDPVFVTLSKDIVLANGVDMAIAGVLAPKPGAAPVTLQMAWKKDDATLFVDATDWPIPLDDGAGFDHMTANDRGVVALRVKDGANRNNEILRITCR